MESLPFATVAQCEFVSDLFQGVAARHSAAQCRDHA
jgi:hypothetical protein